MRFEKVAVSDLQIRCNLHMPAIEVLVSRKRLAHLRTVLTSECTALGTLLSATWTDSNGCVTRLPWCNLVLGDLCLLKAFHSPKLDELGDPLSNADAWANFIVAFPNQWKEYIKALNISSSICDSKKGDKRNSHIDPPPVALDQLKHVCAVCNAAGSGEKRSFSFLTSRALQAHERTVHFARNPIKKYIDGSGVCPICKITFASRLRVIAHCTEKRLRGKARVSCNAVLVSGVVPCVSPETLEKLDAFDRKARNAAVANGRTQPIAVWKATRSKLRGAPDGNCLVDVQQPPCKRMRLNKKSPSHMYRICAAIIDV